MTEAEIEDATVDQLKERKKFLENAANVGTIADGEDQELESIDDELDSRGELDEDEEVDEEEADTDD